MTDDLTETKLAHFEMQQASEGVTGDWHEAMVAATIEIARFIGAAGAPHLSLVRRAELVAIGAALLKGHASVEQCRNLLLKEPRHD